MGTKLATKPATKRSKFWVLKRTWNRNIIHGPYEKRPNLDEWAKGAERAVGGPISFHILMDIDAIRLVNRKGKSTKDYKGRYKTGVVTDRMK